eukprot:jgi/Chlat1/8431/Chrsp80S09226
MWASGLCLGGGGIEACGSAPLLTVQSCGKAGAAAAAPGNLRLPRGQGEVVQAAVACPCSSRPPGMHFRLLPWASAGGAARNASSRARVSPSPGPSPRAASSMTASTSSGSTVPKIQRLHELCRDSLSRAGSPSEGVLDQIRSLLGTISATDVGLRATDSKRKRDSPYGLEGLFGRRSAPSGAPKTSQSAPPIAYLHIQETDAYSIGIFCLPELASIPLHDHPGMTVLSKLLYGSLRVRAYDWLEPSTGPYAARKARQVVDTVVTAPCDVQQLQPEVGNIHEFTALTPCAILDVLIPPYAPHEGRDCTYYAEMQRPGSNDAVLLEPFEPPDDFIGAARARLRRGQGFV